MRTNSRLRLLLCLACGFALTGGSGVALADTGVKSYANIAQRNAFDLKQLLPQTPSYTNPPAPPMAVVRMSGITTILPTARVLLEYVVPGKQIVKAILSAGERHGPIEVLEINARAGTVKIRNGGVETLLTFEKDGIQPPVSSPDASFRATRI